MQKLQKTSSPGSKEVNKNERNIKYLRQLGILPSRSRKNSRTTSESTTRDIVAYFLKNQSLSGKEICRRMGLEPVFSQDELEKLKVMKSCYSSLPEDIRKNPIPIKSLFESANYLHNIYSNIFGIYSNIFGKNKGYEVGRLPTDDSYYNVESKDYIYVFDVKDSFKYSCLAINQVLNHPKEIIKVMREAFSILSHDLGIQTAEENMLHFYFEIEDESELYLLRNTLYDEDDDVSINDLKKINDDLIITIKSDNQLIKDFCKMSSDKHIQKYIKSYPSTDLTNWLKDILFLRDKNFDASENSFISEDSNISLKDSFCIVYDAKGLYNRMIEKNYDQSVMSGYSETGVYIFGIVNQEVFIPYVDHDFDKYLRRIFSFNLTSLQYA